MAIWQCREADGTSPEQKAAWREPGGFEGTAVNGSVRITDGHPSGRATTRRGSQWFLRLAQQLRSVVQQAF